MPRLPSIRPRRLVQFLTAQGFLLDHASGSHMVFYHPETKRRAVVPKHNRDVPKGTLLSLLREAGFTRNDIVEFFRSG